MKTVTFTANEIRALQLFLWCNPCKGGCAYEEMQSSKRDCDNCKLNEAIHSLTEKLFDN